MIFSYDKFSQLEKPTVILAKPDKTYIGNLINYDLKTELYFNSISQATFTVYKYENGIKTRNYDDIEVLKLVEIRYIGWFQITAVNKVGDGGNEAVEVTALSLENELCSVLLTSFGQMGVETDNQGGLDRYCLYSLADKEHSIMHVLMEKAPTWTVGHIDLDITTEYRTFNEDSIDAYSFLTNDVANAFECVFQFDTFNKTISAYKLENIGMDTSIFLSYRNIVNEIKIEEDSDNIKTVMSIVGGDYEGSPLQVSGVNPTGNSYISNFDYYYKWFSNGLKQKYDAYKAESALREGGYSSALQRLKALLEERSDIQNRVPSNENSMNWNEYGIVELQAAFDKYNQKMSLYLDGRNETKRIEYYNILYGTNGIVANQKVRKGELDAVEAKITAQENACRNYVLNMKDFFGADLYKELSNYFRYADYVDDTYVATSIMTDAEVMDMQKELLQAGRKELAKISKPSYTMTVDSQNFPAMAKYIPYTEQLYLGNILTVEFEDGTMIESRLLKIIFDWEDYSNFQLIFSSKTCLDEGWADFAEVQQQASSSSTSQAISGIGWDAAKNQVGIVADFMRNALDAAKNKLFAGKNEEFKIDGTGTLWRKWLDEKNDYSPNQMWGTSNGLFLTNSAWKTVDVAIGELNIGKDANGNDIILYGIAAPLLLGKMTISEALYIFNDSGTYSMTKDGFIASNGTNTLKITPNNDCIFSVLKNNDKTIWFDSLGNAWFKGNVTASEITSSKFTCTNGINAIFIDPNSSRLFQITKNGSPVLYFTDSGDAVFKGKMTVGTIFSDNWLTSGGNESGTSQGTQGTFIDLTRGTFHFGGEHLELSETFLKCSSPYGDSFSWMGFTYPNQKRFVQITGGYIQTQYSDGSINLFMTPRGIATGTSAEINPNAPNVNSGVIDFYSTLYGSNYNGVSIISNGSPVGLRSNKSAIIINPNAYDNGGTRTHGECFSFIVNTNSNGHLRYGLFESKQFSSGLIFNAGEAKVKITDGASGKGNLECDEVNAEAVYAKDIILDGKNLASIIESIKDRL